MKKLWAVGGVLVVGLVWWLSGDGEPALERVDVTRPEEVPTKAEAASSVRPSPSLEAAPKPVRPADSPAASKARAAVAGKRRANESLVARAWNETASRQDFHGPDDPPPPKKYAVDYEGIKAAVQNKKPELRECYEPWLKTQPDLSGKTVVTFDITRDDEQPDTAKIREVAVKTSQLDHPFVEGCVQSVMQDLVFDPPKDGKITVNYPLVFASDAPRP